MYEPVNTDYEKYQRFHSHMTPPASVPVNLKESKGTSLCQQACLGSITSKFGGANEKGTNLKLIK